MKTSKIFLLLAISISHFSCEDKFYKKKFDVEYSITNMTDEILPEIKLDGNNGTKVWIFKNVSPGKTKKVTFNIKRELKTSEGNLSIIAFFKDKDSVQLGAAYYSNWTYYPTDPTKFEVYDSVIVARR